MRYDNDDWGMTQESCFAPALDPASAPLDERGDAEFMAMATRFAKLLNFFDLEDKVVSDWVPFFGTEMNFLLADICSTRRPDELASNASEDSPELQRIALIIERIDRWYQQACAHDLLHLNRPGAPITQTLASAITQDLAPLLRKLENRPAWAQKWNTLLGGVTLSAAWQEGQAESGPDELFELPAMLIAFEAAQASLQRIARGYLEQSYARSDHLPHATLFIAFLELFKRLQADMNQFTGRQLNYYYRTILRLAPAGTQPDRTVLRLQLQPSNPSFLLPAGSQFNAGKDSSGAAIVFASERDVALNQTGLAALRSLYVERDPKGTVLGVQAAPVADSADGSGAPLPDPAAGWSTFGAALGAPAAELGFVITSPALALAQGERFITLTLQFAGADVMERVNAYAKSAAEATEEPQGLTWEQAMQNAFLLHVGTASGWQQVVFFQWRMSPEPNSLAMQFTLASDAPALQANPALAPGSTNWPSLKLTLNPLAWCYAYSWLQDLSLSAASLQVEVKGLTGAQVDTADGPIAAGKPFAPFGAAPQVGAAFRISHPELSAKRVTNATVTLGWQNLPADAGGFASYYHGYAPYEFSNGIFTAAVAGWNQSQWVQQANPYPLFAQDGRQILLPQSRFALDLSALNWSWSGYEQAVRQGATLPTALQFTLAAPAYAFGSAIFARLFAETAIKNVKLIQDEFKKIPSGVVPTIVMPNQPFVPLAKSVSIDYQASDQLVLNAPTLNAPLQFFHLHPFGYAMPEQVQPGLFPQYPENGYLYLGLSDSAPPQTLSLHFQIRPLPGTVARAGVDGNAAGPAPIAWSYLSGNRWLDFDSAAIDSETAELTGSGIVILQLPAKLSTGDSIMSGISSGTTDALTWISVSTQGDPANYGNTLAILPQAATVARQVAAMPPQLPLPAASIGKTMQAIPQIKSVSQPFASWGGAVAETTRDFRARVSTRLRHKQRASQLRDYEQIILTAFPQLAQVKCIGPNNSRHFGSHARVAPGQVVLAVTPPISDPPQQTAPMDGNALGAIAQQARALSATSLVAVTARNVCYESLKIFVKIVLKPNQDSGTCLQKLNAVLSDALSPWRRQAHLDIGCGKVEVAQLARLIRDQDFVAEQSPVCVAQTWQTLTSHHLRWINEGQSVVPNTPWSVLVPAAQHGIDVVDGTQVPAEPPEGIGSMTVAADFIVETPPLLGVGAPVAERAYMLVMRPPADTARRR